MNKTIQIQSRILEEASSLFIHYGFEKTTMDDIALAAKCSKRTLYNHFNDKEKLFIAAVSVKLDSIKSSLSGVIQDDNISIGNKFVTYFTQRMELFNAFLLYATLLREDLFNQSFKSSAVNQLLENFRKWEYNHFIWFAEKFAVNFHYPADHNSAFLADMLQMETKALDSFFFIQRKYDQYVQSYYLILNMITEAIEMKFKKTDQKS